VKEVVFMEKDHAGKGRVLVAIRAKGKTKEVLIAAKSREVRSWVGNSSSTKHLR